MGELTQGEAARVVVGGRTGVAEHPPGVRLAVTGSEERVLAAAELARELVAADVCSGHGSRERPSEAVVV
jgi:hypothetical protein